MNDTTHHDWYCTYEGGGGGGYLIILKGYSPFRHFVIILIFMREYRRMCLNVAVFAIKYVATVYGRVKKNAMIKTVPRPTPPPLGTGFSVSGAPIQNSWIRTCSVSLRSNSWASQPVRVVYAGPLIRWIIYNSRFEFRKQYPHMPRSRGIKLFLQLSLFLHCRCPKSVTLTTTVQIF